MSLLAGRPRFPYLNIVLLGKTGNGKSSTGNSLLCNNAFQTSDDHGKAAFESVTKALGFSQTKEQIVLKKSSKANHDFDSVQLRIYDTPGFFDSEMLDEDQKIYNDLNNEIRRLRKTPGKESTIEQFKQQMKEHSEAAQERRKEAIREEVLKCVIKSCSEGGIHAFLYVIKYKDRIDKSQMDTLNLIEETFGEAQSPFCNYLPYSLE